MAAAIGAPALSTGSARAQPPAVTAGARDTFRLGIAGYTFAKFKLDQTLEMLKRVDVHYLCIKDFHLPLKSTDEEIAAFHAKCQSFGVTGYGVGPIYMGSEEEANQAFGYAKRVGVKTLVGVPFKLDGNRRVASPELLQLIHQRVKEYDLKYAIHNHGPDMPELFPSAESAMEFIKEMDSRVGLCLDIGHQLRDGKDPVRALHAFPERIHDIHIKNVTSPNKQGRGIELPRGAIDFPALVRALRQIKYAGVCSLEYEKDMETPLTGIAECIGYFRGVVDATRA
jgi:sugar phosphate isomerase/epimerase